MLFFTCITVAELKIRKPIGSLQRTRSNQIQSQHHAVLNVHHRQVKSRKLIGSCQRARSNQIQSQHHASLHVHHHRRAKDKDAYWLTSESRIQSDSKITLQPFLTTITVAELKTRKLIGSRRRARSDLSISSVSSSNSRLTRIPSFLSSV